MSSSNKIKTKQQMSAARAKSVSQPAIKQALSQTTATDFNRKHTQKMKKTTTKNKLAINNNNNYN